MPLNPLVFQKSQKIRLVLRRMRKLHTLLKVGGNEYIEK